MKEENTENNGVRRCSGHSQGQCGDEPAADRTVIRRLGGDDAVDLALAVGFRVLGGALGFVVGDEVRHASAGSGKDADEGADDARADQVDRAAQDLLQHATETVFLPGLVDHVGVPRAQRNEADDLRNGEQADQCGHQRNTALQHRFAKGEADVTAHRRNAHRGQEQAK